MVQIYSSAIAVKTETLWSRFKNSGVRVPLTLTGTIGDAAFLRRLFGMGATSGPPLFGSTIAGSDRDGDARSAPAATLADVYATMAHWLGERGAAATGRPIEAIIGNSERPQFS